MELLQLQYFIAIAQGDTLSSAAERFSISQSSLSRSLAMLEEELGVPLFDRSNKRLVPTARGDWLLQQVRPLVAGLDRIKSTIATTMDIGGIVVLQIELMLPHLREAINEYQAAHPEQQVRLQMPWQPGNIFRDAPELTITGAPVGVALGSTEVLCQEELLLLVADQYCPAEPEVDLLDFMGRRFLMMPTNASNARAACETLCRYAGFEPRTLGETDNLEEVRRHLTHSESVIAAFVSSYRLGSIPAGLSAVRIREPDPLRSICLSWGVNLTQAARELRDFLLDYYRRPALRNILQEQLAALGVTRHEDKQPV